MDQSLENLLQEGDELMEKIHMTTEKSPAFLAECKIFAKKLYRQGVDMNYSKVTDCSPYIEKLYRKALAIAELVCEENDPDFLQYKKDVEYYDNFQK